MKKIQKGKIPKVNLGSESDDAYGSFKVTLQKPSKIKSGLDKYVVGKSVLKRQFQLRCIIITKGLFTRAICQK